jgi:hypothetical protein
VTHAAVVIDKLELIDLFNMLSEFCDDYVVWMRGNSFSRLEWERYDELLERGWRLCDKINQGISWGVVYEKVDAA